MDLIEMAKEAGLWEERGSVEMAIGGVAELERLEALIRADERKKHQQAAAAPVQVSIEVMRQVLEFCEFCWRDVPMNEHAFERTEQTITTLRTAIEQAAHPAPVQEPPTDEQIIDVLLKARRTDLEASGIDTEGLRQEGVSVGWFLPYARAVIDAFAPPAARPAEPLTDEECDRIYTALDQWAREFDQYEFGLPTHCGDGMIGGRAIIRAAHGTKGDA